jgi:hypothetical protein
MKSLCTLLILLSIAFYGCTKPEPNTVETFNKSDFPTTVGSYWIYQCYDYRTNMNYPVKHKIEWRETINTDTQIIHYTLYAPDQSVRDSAIGILTKTGFTYLGVRQTNYSILGDFHIAFPFSKSDKWVSVNTNDTLQVVTHASKYVVSTDTFSNVFYLYNYYRQSLNVRENEIYLSKGIGIITKNIRKENGNSQLDEKRSYVLTSYHLE